MKHLFGAQAIDNSKAITFKQSTSGNWYALPVSMVIEFDSMDMNEQVDQSVELYQRFFNFQITSPSQHVAEMLGETEDE